MRKTLLDSTLGVKQCVSSGVFIPCWAGALRCRAASPPRTARP